MHKILVINPNSNADVTVKLSDIFCEYHISKNTKVDCISIQEGPFGIESDEDIHHVSPLVKKKIKNEKLKAKFWLLKHSSSFKIARTTAISFSKSKWAERV